MRFLTLMGSGVGIMTANESIVFSTTGKLRKRGVIGEGVPSSYPVSMIQASNGTLLIATGLGPMYRMRRNEGSLSQAGVPAPTTAIHLLSSNDYASENSGVPDPLGTGKNIVLVTFDFSQYGNVRSAPGTNGALTAQARQSLSARQNLLNLNYNKIAAITASELGQPPYQNQANQYAQIRVSSQLYGYHAEQNGIPVSTLTPAGTAVWNNVTGSFYVYEDTTTDVTGQYQCFQRWVDKDGYVSDPGPLSQIVTISSRNIVKYSDVEAPTDTRIVKRQIWRNDSGQVQNFYLDIETTDLVSTEFTSSNSDAQLVLNDVITFTDVDGYTIPYLYGQPPDDKPFIAELRGRIFAVGSRRYSTGSVQVVNGSKTITGTGTDWSPSMVGRRIIVGNKEYLISSVDSDAQTMMISVNYAGLSDNFALYVVAPYAAEELVVRWSDPVAGPEAWPKNAQLLLPQDGDVITGLFNYGDALYITKTRSIYRLNFTEDPAVDGECSPAAKRGCINNRCAVQVEGALLCLDRQGIHAFIGGPNPQHVSLPVGDLFREETDGLHINWAANLDLLHSIDHHEISTAKWYVPLAGDMFPSHALCYDYRRSRFWVESYPRPVTSSCHSLAITGRPLLGTTEGRILAADVGSLDLIEPGGTFFTITAVNSPYSVTLDSTPKTCTGVPVVIVNGSAAGNDRIVSYQTGNEIQFLTPLTILPSVGDKVQLGGVPFTMKTGVFCAQSMDGNNVKSITIKFDPNQSNLYGALSIYKDGVSKPSIRAAARATWHATTRNHLKNARQVTIDFGSSLGVAAEQMSFPGESDTPDNLRYQFQIDGSSGEFKPKIMDIVIEGATQQ